MNKQFKILLIILLIILVLIFFIKITYKSIFVGNNISKSSDDLIKDILNISSYEASLEITVSSNKTKNKYVLEQYYLNPNFFKQVVKSPSNIENLEIIYNGNNLEIKNTNLGLSKIYENYTYLNENLLWLSSFINHCNNNEYSVEEINNEIILTVKIKKYNGTASLYINKEIEVPTKMQILDNSKQCKIYIEYKEIKLNNIQKDNILALLNKNIKKQV